MKNIKTFKLPSTGTSSKLDEICEYLGVARNSINDAEVVVRAEEVLEKNRDLLMASIYRLPAFIAAAKAVYSQSVRVTPEDQLLLTIHWNGSIEASGYYFKSDPDGVRLKCCPDGGDDDTPLPTDAERVANELARCSLNDYILAEEFYDEVLFRIRCLGGDMAGEYADAAEDDHSFIVVLY